MAPMIRWLLFIFVLLASVHGTAMADPVTLVVVAVQAAAAYGAISTVTALALTLTVSLIGAADQRRKAAASADAALAAYNASLQDRNVTVLRNDSPWQIVYGSPAPVGGTLVAILSSGGSDQYKHMVVVFAAHECLAIDEIYIEGDPLGTLDGSGWVTGGAFMDSGTARVNAQKHLSPSGVDTADAFLIAAAPTFWTSAHKLSGYTYAVITLDLNLSRFQGGPPNITAKLRGKKIYDYRTATTGYSANPALCVADFLTSVYGYSATSGQIDTAAAIAAANACDTQGFNCHGALSTDNSRETNLHALEDSMAGRSHWSGGVWRIIAGIWTTPVITLTDAYLAAPIEVTQAGNPRTTRYNSVRGKYIPAAQLGVTVDFTPYVVSSYVTADGPNQWLDVSYGFTASNSECQKLAAIAVERSRAGLTINYPAHLTAWKLQPGDRVYVTNAELGFAAKTFRVVDWTHINNAPLGLVLTEDVASMYTGTYSIADPLAATSNLANPYARPAAPSSLAANSGTGYLTVLGDGTVQTRVYCTWAASTQRAVLQGGYAQIQWKLTSDPDANYASTDLPPDATSALLTGPKDSTNITVRVRFITGVGAIGAWSTITHTVVGKTAPPPAFDFFTVFSQPDGTRQFNFGYNAGNKPADWQGAEIRYISGTTSTPTWSAMTLLQDSTTFYTNSPVEINAPLPGTYTFACKSIDTTGNESAYLVVNITLPPRRLGNVFAEYFEGPAGWLGTLSGCQVLNGTLEALDSTTWAGLPATWAAWARWNTTPTSPISYVTPARDFGTVVAGQINTTVDADGTLLLELATSSNGTTWSGWSSAAAPFSTRYLKLRLTVTANGTYPVPVVRQFDYQINAAVKSEYINDVAIASLTGAYRIGTGDIRIPLAGTYSVIKRTAIVIQDSSAGTWSWARLDQSLSPAPRIQFRLNGVLADPAFVDFQIEGY